MKKLLSVTLLAAGMCANAQETDYKRAYMTYQLEPTLPQYSSYKTFDVTLLTTREEADKPGTGFNLPYEVKIGQLAQVPSGADFHVISLLQRMSGKMASPSTALVNVALNTTVYNKFGAVVTTGSVVNEQYTINFGRELKKEETSNADVMRRLIVEKLIEASTKPLSDGLYGAKIEPVVRLAQLEDVKKNSPLKQFEEQVKVLKPALEKEGLSGFRTAAQPYVSFWEQNTSFAEGEKEKADEVKRAALHNLSLYYIAGRETDKAAQYLEQYKAIDKQIKEMMGLIKYKNSEDLEKFMNTIYPAASGSAGVAQTSGKELTTEQVVDAHRYILIDGTVTVKEKKQAGTYQGLIKVNKIPKGSFGNIASLDPENIAVVIQTKDATGSPLTINTTVSQIEELKERNGTSFITQKFGTAVLGDGSYHAFLQSTYTSPKVTVYRALLPAGSSDWVVRKNGDVNGVKSSLFNARKGLEEYLADCAPLTEKLKSGAIDKKTPVEKIAEAYTACQ